MRRSGILARYKSGKCSCCPYVIRLRVNGTVAPHKLYGGIRWAIDSQYRKDKEAMGRIYHDDGSITCEGTGKLPIMRAC